MSYIQIFARKIDVVAKFKENGNIEPIKFRVNRNDGSQAIVIIDRVIEQRLDKTGGYEAIVIMCEADGKKCELKFWKEDCKWMLFRA